MNEYRERVYRLGRQIPMGRVMTYGQIAELLDTDRNKYTPQTVGWAMHALGDTDCWARVINASGGCSTGKVMLPGNKQQFILEHEGVIFDEQGHCNLETFLWIPDDETAKDARDWTAMKPATQRAFAEMAKALGANSITICAGEREGDEP